MIHTRNFMKNIILKKIVKYFKENENLRIQQIEHRIELLQKQKEQVQSHIDNLKNTMEHLKNKKEKIADEIAKLRFAKQKENLTDRGLI